MIYLFFVVWGASTIVFLLIRVIPGDPATLMAGEYASPGGIERLREQLGIDLPIHEQYVKWMVDTVTGNFGRSFRNSKLISAELLERAPATIELALTSLCLGSLLGLLIGILAATNRQTWVDHLAMLLSLIGIAVPVFWIGLVMILLFSVELGWLPLGGRISATTTLSGPTGFLVIDAILARDVRLLLETLRHLALPAIALSAGPMATVARVTRSSMLEVLRQDYVRTARAKGLAWRDVVFRHALRNALVPVITVIGVSIGPLVGGAVLTENVFGWPGLGRYVVSSINSRDYPAIQAMVFVSAAVFAAVSMVVDITYALIDPRIRYE